MMTNHPQTHLLSHVDSIRSENSVDEGTYRNAYKDSSWYGPPIRDHSYYKVLDVDPDGIQVMGEVDLQQLPEAVNREIMKNSREIIYEEPETPREGSPLLRSISGRRAIKYPLLDEERRSLHSCKRSLHHKNYLRYSEEDRRSLDGSRKNLNGSRRYLLVPLDSRTLEPSIRENLPISRRHTGSKECLNTIRKNVCAKGSKETPELGVTGRLNSNNDRLTIEVERDSKPSPRLQEMVLPEKNRTSLSDPNLSPNGYTSSSKDPSPVPAIALSPTSDLSPESGFYERLQWNSSPECIRRDLRLPNESVMTRNRRSYENAQLQDVNEVLSRPNSENSSLHSEESVKNSTNENVPHKYGEKDVVAKQAISYTSV